MRGRLADAERHDGDPVGKEQQNGRTPAVGYETTNMSSEQNRTHL